MMDRIPIQPCKECFNSTIQFLQQMESKEEFIEHITALIGGSVYAFKISNSDDEAIKELISDMVEQTLAQWHDKQ